MISCDVTKIHFIICMYSSVCGCVFIFWLFSFKHFWYWFGCTCIPNFSSCTTFSQLSWTFFLHFLAEMILKVEMLFRKCVIVYVYIWMRLWVCMCIYNIYKISLFLFVSPESRVYSMKSSKVSLSLRIVH